MKEKRWKRAKGLRWINRKKRKEIQKERETFIKGMEERLIKRKKIY